MLASKHLDMIFGIDIHLVNIPPAVGVPMPHPFIGFVFDPMDYIPILGTNIHINGMKRANAGTGAKLTTLWHIPMGAGFTTPPTIGNDGVMFFGSSTVSFNGSYQSVAPQPLMTCSCLGMPLMYNPAKPKGSKLSRYLSCSWNIPMPLGRPVNIGGPIMPDFVSAFKRLAIGAAFGLAFKWLGKLGSKIFGMMKGLKGKFSKFKWPKFPKRTKCNDPVDPVSGSCIVLTEDFSLSGPIPFKWERFWTSASDYEGPLGFGWHHKYDWAMELFPDDNYIILRMEEGRHCAFPFPDEEKPIFERIERLTLSYKNNHYQVYDHENRQTYHFEHRGNPESNILNLYQITNSGGFAINFSYNQGKLVQIIDSSGRELNLKNDSLGRIETIILDEKAKLTTLIRYKYNSSGDLTEVFDALNVPTKIFYQEHLMVKRTDRNGVSFFWDYESSGIEAKCIHTWGPDGLLEGWFEYHQGYTLHTDSLGNVTTYYYNEDGLVTKKIDPLGNETNTDYNIYQEVISETNALGEITCYGYDETGNRTSIQSAGGSTLNLVYENDLPVMAMNGNKALWLWEYDSEGNLQRRIDPEGGIIQFKFEKGLLKSIIDAQGEESTFEYTDQFNLEKMNMPGGRNTRWHYNYRGLCTSMYDAADNWTLYQHDDLGRVVKMSTPDDNETKFKYNAYDEVISAIDKHHRVEFEFTPLGSLKSRIENNTRVNFYYNTEEQLVSIANEEGNSYRFKRNGAGQITEETGFDGLTRKYKRDSAGRVERVIQPDGRETIYTYNADGLVNKIQHHNGEEEYFSYDKEGNLIEALNRITRVAFERTKAGRVLKETQGFAEVISQYNKLGQRTKISSSLGAEIDLEYNTLGELRKTKVKQEEAQWQAEMTYNSLGLEIERLLPGGIKNNWQYTKDGRPQEQLLSDTNGKLRHKQYKWDVNDRLKNITDLITKTTAEFTHDIFGNLESANYGNGEWDYRLPDVVGNLFRTKDRKDRKYGAAGQLIESPKYFYTYDELGNLKAKKDKKTGEVWYYEWNNSGMLTKVTRPDKQEVIFRYDALGRRVEKEFNGKLTRWIWDGNVVLHEWTEEVRIASESKNEEKESFFVTEGREKEAVELSSLQVEKDDIKLAPKDLITWIFDEGTFVPAAKLQNGTSYSIITDHLGTPAQILNDNGTEVWKAELDIYGKIRKIDLGSPTDCPFRYQGQYEDVETGLYCNRFRYYDPEDGVYVSQDPIKLTGGNPNIYAYTIDVNIWVDVYGLGACKLAQDYEKKIRNLYGNVPFGQRKYTSIVNGKQVNGVADNIAQIGNKIVAIEAKFVKNWSKSIRNPNSKIGSKSFALAEQEAMLSQAQKYSNAFDEVIYHTNSPDLATHYTQVFNNAGINNFSFIITP